MTNHAGQGRLTGALPNGRRAQRPFASGITPVSQEARDLGSCLDAVARLEARHIPGGEALNLKFPSLKGSDDVERLGALVEGHFRNGGMHLQCNVMSYPMLLEARAHHERHPDPSGSRHSAFFNDLNDAMKEDHHRTAYEPRTSGRSTSCRPAADACVQGEPEPEPM
jgi:formate C-acetyltransferase